MTDDSADSGLALLLADGVADGMAVAQATLATVQSAAIRAFAGLTQMQAAGAAAAAVPPVAPATETASAMADGLEEQHWPVPPPAPTSIVQSAVAEQVGFAPTPVAQGDTQVSTPVASDRALVSFATFAPLPMPVAMADAVTSQPRSAEIRPGAVRDPQRTFAQDAMAPAAPAATQTPRVPTPPSYAPPAAQATQSGPTGGDVFLDGARVGTWLADHLAREAGRPQMGGTGIDPRLTPAWPGTLQGG